MQEARETPRHGVFDAEGRPLDEHLTLERLAAETGLSSRLLTLFVRCGLIDPVEEQPEPVFEAHIMLRVGRIQRLRRDLRLNLHGVGVVLELLERVEELERELTRLR